MFKVMLFSQRAYVFNKRPLTPSRLPKQEEYLHDLDKQVINNIGTFKSGGRGGRGARRVCSPLIRTQFDWKFGQRKAKENKREKWEKFGQEMNFSPSNGNTLNKPVINNNLRLRSITTFFSFEFAVLLCFSNF